MKKSLAILFSSIIIGILTITIIFYILTVITYRGGFPYNTWVNGVYCTGKTVDEVNNELVALYDPGEITITSDYGKEEVISLSHFVEKVDFRDYLNHLSSGTNPYLWFINLKNWFSQKEIEPSVTYNREMVELYLSQSDLFKAFSEEKERKCYIRRSPAGAYELYKDDTPLIDKDSLYDKVYENLYKGAVITVDDIYFSEPDYKEASEAAIKEWDLVSDFFETKIFYDFGDEMVPIDSTVLSEFVTLTDDNTFLRDSEGNLLLSEKKIEEYVSGLCSKYNTYLKERKFTTHDGVDKVIAHSYYGTEIDISKEKKYLVNAIKTGISEEHIPAYIKEPFHRGLNDIGDEYIEVDLTNQKLFYIKNNEVKLETDVVTGKPDGHSTPEMVCFVYKKQKNAVLVGEDYRSPVSYWMPVHKGIGLHDATWQKKFGGERFLTHGSHGCINMKKEDAKWLFYEIKVGIPVIIYK